MFDCMFTLLPFTLCPDSLRHHSHSFFLPVNYFSFLPQNEMTSGKVLFPEHLPLSRIQAGIKSGSFLQGTFRASRDNYLEATVFVQGEGEDSTEVCVCFCLWTYNIAGFKQLFQQVNWLGKIVKCLHLLKARYWPFGLLPGSHPGSSEPQQSSEPGCGCRAAVTTESVGGALFSRAAGRRRSKGR